MSEQKQDTQDTKKKYLELSQVMELINVVKVVRGFLDDMGDGVDLTENEIEHQDRILGCANILSYVERELETLLDHLEEVILGKREVA